MAYRRPRPINVKDRLAIITDEQQIHEIDVDCSPEKPQIKVEGKKRPERERRYVNGLSMLPAAQMVPIPLFREIKEDKVSKKQRPFELPSKYITYDEPTPDEEEHIIDYDMDSEDEKFLTALNNQSSISSAQHLAGLKEQEFEALFDLFEKTHQKMKEGLDETFPKVIAHLFRMIRAEDTEDATCAVCNDGEYAEDNMIIFCDGCNIGVHQACYGLKMIPPKDFYCDRCKYIRECEKSKRTSGKNAKIPQVRCEFCTVKTGAFKPLLYLNHNGKHQPRWAHVSCAMWIPECSFSDTPTLDPILALPVPSRNKHKCCVCNENTGVSFKCSEKNCHEYFHVMCGRSRDYSMYARPACVKAEKNKIKQRTLNNNSNLKNKNNSNNNTDYNGNLIEGDHLEFVQYCEIHSLKSEIQRTDSHFGYSKLTDEELGELDAFVTTSRGLTLPAYSTELVYWYWRWRRKHHAGSFLRKFHALTPLTTFFEKHRTTPAECLDKMKSMRQHFETLRILLDLMKKREHIKKELIETRSQSVDTEFRRLREYIGWLQTPRRSPRKSPGKRRGQSEDLEDEIEQYFQDEESEQEEEEPKQEVQVEEDEDDMVLVPEYFEDELQLEIQQLEAQRQQQKQKQKEEESVEFSEEAEEESIDVEAIEIVDPELVEEEDLEPQEDVQEQPEAEETPDEFDQDLPALIEEPQQQADEPVILEQHEEEEELPREEEEFSVEFGEDQEIDYNVSSGGEHEAPPPTGSLPVTPTRNTADSDSDVSGAEESYDSLDLEVARNKNFTAYWEDQERLDKIASIRNGFSRGGTVEEPIVIEDVSEVEEIVEEQKVQKNGKRKRASEKNSKSPVQPRKKRKKRKKLFSVIRS